MAFDKSLLDDELFVRVQQMQLTHLGFHIHPDRLFLLADCRETKDTAYINQVIEIGHRYFEIDVCVLTAEGDAFIEDDNIYTIEDVSPEKELVLGSKATAIISDNEELLALAKDLLKPTFNPNTKLVTDLSEHMQKMGLNREGTSSVAINEDDTTRKINYGCDNNV